MANPVLTSGASMACPHLGPAMETTQSLRVRASGQPILTVSNSLAVTGCPFSLPSGPAPCAQVVWQMGSLRVRSAGEPVLTTGAQGIAIGAAGPQGPPQIQFTQLRVKAA